MLWFQLRVLGLAPLVFIRMIPVFLVAGFAVYLFVTRVENPVIFWPVILGFYPPFLAFLALSAVRAGLVTLRATGAPSLQSLYQMMWYFLRFNANLSIGLSALAALPFSAYVLRTLDPELLQEIFDMITSFDLSDAQRTFGKLAPYTLPLALIWTTSLSIAFGITGGAMGSTAASAAGRTEAHDRFWGYGRDMPGLTLLGLLVLVLPSIPVSLYLVPQLGEVEIAWPLTPATEALAIILAYLGGALCVLASGAALAYVRGKEEDVRRHVEEVEDMIGPQHAGTDIRALREARQARNHISR
ncbi:MAG: hypothetical protein AAGJ92_09035 [Pseudomonadota bacterium]